MTVLAPSSPSFGSWLRRQRTSLQLTQAALAQRAGCAADVLRKFEAGTKRPSRKLAERLADELGLSGPERAAFVEAARAAPPPPRAEQAPPARPAPPGSEGSPATLLARTKLRPPRVRADVVLRPRLLDAVRRALQTANLLLLSAPAGSGKTTLLANALAGDSALTVAWLTLDEDDNDSVRFLQALVVAVENAVPGAAGMARQALAAQAGQEQGDRHTLGRQVIVALINDLDRASAGPVVLALDDLHLITDPVVHAALDYLIERLPDGVAVAIATRGDPPLALARLRARQALVELRLPELRFTVDEVATLLEWRRLDLAPAEIAALHQRTEGWAAGLALLAASLERIGAGDEQRRFLQHLAHSERYIFEYLADEVLSRQDPFVRMFLLETAILPELTPDVCRRITGRDDAAAILDDLYRRNLFVVAVEQDGGRLAYRYHDLFAAFLRARLQRELPEWTRELHRRAAEADPVAARRIYHYMHAALWDDAARTIEQLGEQLVTQGAVTRVRAWLEALPAEVRESRPRLQYLLGICALQIWELDTATAFFERALDGFRAAGDALGQGEALACLSTCRSTTGDFAGAAAAMEQALRLPTSPHLRVQLLIGRAWQSLAAGAWPQAAADIDEALALTDASGDRRALHALAVNYHAPMAVLAGGLARSERLIRLVSRLAPDSDFLQAAADTQLAWIYIWRNDWERGMALAERVLQVSDQIGGLFGSAVEARIILPMCAALQGQTERADAAFAALFASIAQPEAETWAKTWAAGFDYSFGRIRWLQGRLAEARVVYERMCAARHDQEWPHTPAVRAALHGMLLLSEQRYSEAEDAFRGAVELQAAMRVPLLYNDMRLLLAYCYLQANNRPDALRILTEAMDEHVAEGTPGRIRFEGSRIAVPLLQLAVAHGLHPAFATDLLASMGAAPLPEPIEPVGVTAPGTGEILSPREVEVLRLLMAGASNQAIADTLVISLHTAKHHVSSVLQKLGVASRTQAALHGRALGLAPLAPQ